MKNQVHYGAGKSVAVIACGWFGFALAKHLVAVGYRVTGCKRSEADLPELTQAGIEAYPLELDGGTIDVTSALSASTLTGLLQTDYLVVNIPPRLKRGNTAYLNELAQLIALTQGWQYQRVIFVSTTGVYPSRDACMQENNAEAGSTTAQTLLDAEALFHALPNSCVVRFAGLVGPKRHPGRFFAGKIQVAGANVAVNLVHLTDCVNGVATILAAEQAASVYNLCAPEHPTKADFYVAAAIDLGLVPPSFTDEMLPSKVIDGSLISRELGFQYQFSNPLQMLAAC